MKKKMSFDPLVFDDCNLFNQNMLIAIKGGSANGEEQYVVIYINGIPYRVKKNSSGQIIDMRPLYTS